MLYRRRNEIIIFVTYKDPYISIQLKYLKQTVSKTETRIVKLYSINNNCTFQFFSLLTLGGLRYQCSLFTNLTTPKSLLIISKIKYKTYWR